MVTNLNILGAQMKGQAKNELIGEDLAEDGKFNLYKLTLIEALAKKKEKKERKPYTTTTNSNNNLTTTVNQGFILRKSIYPNYIISITFRQILLCKNRIKNKHFLVIFLFTRTVCFISFSLKWYYSGKKVKMVLKMVLRWYYYSVFRLL